MSSETDAGIEWIEPFPRKLIDADDSFVGLDAKVVDFWQFALGDLRMNNARGYLAEFLVGKALDISPLARIEWAAFDLLLATADGDISIEVKSSAYLQAWRQRRHSRIVFSGLKGTRYSEEHGYDPIGPRFNALVYVFCVQTSVSHADYDPLDPSSWNFYVVPRAQLEALDQKTVGLGKVEELAGGNNSWEDLLAAVTVAAGGERVDVEAEEWWLASETDGPADDISGSAQRY